MATLTTAKVAAGIQPREDNGVISVSATYSLAAALALNDVIQMVKVPRGARVLDVLLATDDLDTGTAIVLDVGDGGDVDRYIDGATIGQTAGVARAGSQVGFDHVYAADDTVDVLVQVGPTTGATSGDVHLTVIYTLQA